MHVLVVAVAMTVAMALPVAILKIKQFLKCWICKNTI